MENYKDPENVWELTKQEILDLFPRVFKNEFQTRTMQGDPWRVWTNEIFFGGFLFGNGYTKGYSSAAILINSQGEKDVVWFWKYIKHGRMHLGYSFKKRELFETILN